VEAHLGRWYLKASAGDAVNAFLSAIGNSPPRRQPGCGSPCAEY
jgi:hypothetical protein